MLHQLFGNKSIEKILFFLLINGKCYAGRLSTHFKIPLTPLQSSLSKLEKIGVVESYKEKKMRYFQFRSNCSLFPELEVLLRKAFTLLPAEEKSRYYDSEINLNGLKQIKKRRGISDSDFIFNVWERLQKIKNLTFSAVSLNQGGSGWNGTGKGSVNVEKVEESRLIFEERGSWTALDGKEYSFKNIFRWTFDPILKMISLEHLRLGDQHPVFLFHLIQSDVGTLSSIDSHVCNDDTYIGQIQCHDHLIKLNWRVIGPKKNEEIHYLYV